MANIDVIAEGYVDVVSVTTGDASPTVAPHKISAQAGKDAADLHVQHQDQILYYLKVVRDGNAKTGKLLFRRGLVCGANDRCGAGARSMVRDGGLRDWHISLTHATVSDGGADGARTINVYGVGDIGISGGV